MDTFGEWLRQERNNLKLTRVQLAERVGCSVALLRKIEDGERRPSNQIAELLANSLNIPPEQRSTFVKVARGELNVDRLPTPSNQVSASKIPRVNIPALPTPLIDRQRELQELRQLLRDPQCRLMTLVGPGGIGKTRLAIEAAAGLQDTFTDGVYFVPLATVNTTRFIAPLIADAIGFAFQSAGSPDSKTQLFNYLQEKQILLLVDNLEQLLAEPGVELLSELLANALQVKILATSRETLGLQGEWVYEVQGLAVPEFQYVEGSAQNTSVELFLQRARRAHVGFDATIEDYPAIVRICQLVGGTPLAIELAAAWVRMLSCVEIAREIERGMDILHTSERDLPARHRSMYAVFEHSWKLLSVEEQEALLRLSVFRGGFRRDAAEAVAGTTLSTLSTLVAKSLIRRSGAGRYDLHELIHQFASDQFANRPKEHAETQASHCSYYLKYFSKSDGRLRSSAQGETLVELTDEMDNFQVAWDWAVTHIEFALIESTLRTFVLFYDIRGWFQEGFDLLDRALIALDSEVKHSVPDKEEQITLGHLLSCRGLLAFRLARYEQAQALLERSLEILRTLNEPRVLVESITFLGFVKELTSNYAEALELYSHGLEIAKVIDDRWFAALCLLCQIGLSGITQTIVRPEITRERLRSVLADWRAIGDPRFTAIGLNMLSWNALTLGLFDEARAALEESVSLSESVGDRWGLGFAYRGLGIVAQTRGDHSQALEMFGKSLETLTELGARQDVARVLAEMSHSLLALGNDAVAAQNLRKALIISTETQGAFIVMESLVGVATLLMKRGQSEQALELLLMVLEHPASVQGTKDRAARMRIELEAQLTSQQVEAAQIRVKKKSIEAVVDEMLNLMVA